MREAEVPNHETEMKVDSTSSPMIPTDLQGIEKRKFLSLMAADERLQSFGVANLVATVVVTLRFPQFFWILHTVKALIFIPWRFVRFRRDNCELYLLDFCYMATYLTVLCCFHSYIRIKTGFDTGLHQYNVPLIRAGFTFASGSLAWSILIFKNSLVFYNIDQMTSVFIHLSPFVFFWCLRWGSGFGIAMMDEWWPDMFDVCPGVSHAVADSCLTWAKTFQWCDACHADWGDFVWKPAIIYFTCWGVPYYILTFCCMRGWIERNNKETLYALILNDPSKSKFVKLFPECMWPLAYMLQHFLVVAILGCITFLFWHNFLLHTLFGALLLVAAVHNGSTYTFRVFALRYAADLMKENAAMFGGEDVGPQKTFSKRDAYEQLKDVEDEETIDPP